MATSLENILVEKGAADREWFGSEKLQSIRGASHVLAVAQRLVDAEEEENPIPEGTMPPIFALLDPSRLLLTLLTSTYLIGARLATRK